MVGLAGRKRGVGGLIVLGYELGRADELNGRGIWA